MGIGVGLSALLVLTDRACESLQAVERANGLAPRFFFVYGKIWFIKIEREAVGSHCIVRR